MEVGIEDLLNIKIKINKKVYSLTDVLNGTIEFSIVKILIKKMDLHLIRKEIIGSGTNQTTNSEDLYKFEIMDGCPIKE